jgi:hypothetical protein
VNVQVSDSIVGTRLLAMGKRKAAVDGPAQPARGAPSKPHGKPPSSASDIDAIFGKLGAAKPAPAASEPPTADRKRRTRADGVAPPSATGAKSPAKKSRKSRDAGEPAEERSVPSSFAPPDRAERAGWVDDGLGGVHNSEGWTGRKTEDGFRIFKTRLLQTTKRKKSGGTPLCPFDCDCCYV